ncbi:non-ribosomal peptide synthetase [Flavobacterium sp. WG21]|uniref:non-ribosomal peptide synthetase n=1 Tax=Flavobacterium sp. WG21 TaxID=1229487 RepID=UPI0003806B38|nr:non-ribosomal peptide synthetase [Flavobacterium sp. WG21]
MNKIEQVTKKVVGDKFTFTLNKGYELSDVYVQKRFTLDPSSRAGIAKLVNDNSRGFFIFMLSAIAIVVKKFSQDPPIFLSVPDNKNSPVALQFAILDYITFREILNIAKNNLNKLFSDKKIENNEREADENKEITSNVIVLFDGIHDISSFIFDDFDLVFIISLTDYDLFIDLTFNKGCFEEQQIEAFMEHLNKTIGYYGMLDLAYSDIDIFTEKQKFEMISKGIGYASDICYTSLQELFEAQVEKYPHNIAIQYNDIQLTYEQLNAKSNQLANHLIDVYGVKPGDLVGVMIEKSESMIIAILGILKAGGAYVPIDINLPKQRREFIIADADINTLLINSSESFNITNEKVKLFALDVQMDMLEESEENLNVKLGKQNSAYLIYTSGTSGSPKGVLVTHIGIVNTILNQSEILNIQNNDKVLQFASLSFDASVSEIFMALGTGATLIVIDNDIVKNTDYFVDYIKTAGVSVLTLPPAYLYSLAIDELSFLRVLLTAGEPIKVEVANRLRKIVNYYNAYGPTECSVCVSMYHYNTSIEHVDSIPIGTPLSNTSVIVLDNARKLVPEGAEGELYVSGIGLAEGYLRNIDLTKSKFITDLDLFENRWYKTGDVVKWSKGQLIFCGRKDRQIKLRGFRIEPEEIEYVLKSHALVQNAYVYCPASSLENGILKAVVTVDSEQAATIHKILEIEKKNPDLGKKRYVLPNNLTIYHSNEYETKMIYDEIFEQKIYDRNGLKINEGDIIFDVGSNIGLFSLYVGLNYDNVKIYSFEPIKEIFDIMEKNLSLYPLNVNTFNAGISKETKKALFQYYPDNTAMSGMYGGSSSEMEVVKQYMKNKMNQNQAVDEGNSLHDLVSRKMTTNTVECQLFSLSEIIVKEKISKIDLLKIDVEKSEKDVLEGILDEHWPIIKQIVIEVHDLEGRIDYIKQLLSSKGFELSVSQDKNLADTDIYNIHAKRDSKFDDEKYSNPIEKLSRPITSLDLCIEEIKSLCAEKLPSYMNPALIDIIYELPLSNNGKIDDVLLEKLVTAGNNELVPELPRNEKESVLFEIWTQILTKKPVSIYDDFFSLGGDSIKAIQIASKLYLLNYKIDINKIFEYPTIALLSGHIELTNDQISQSPVVGDIPLSPIQLELFANGRKAPQHFNQSVLLFFEKRVQPIVIEKVFTVIQEHHDVLRATMNKKGETWTMYNNDINFPISIRKKDLIGEHNFRKEIEKASQELQESIDLEKGPLMKLGLFSTDEGDYLLIVIHHLVIDTVSWRVLLKDVDLLINQYQEGEKLTLPLKTNSFKEWTEFLYGYANSPKFKEEKQFWIDLEKTTPCKLPLKNIDSNTLADAEWIDFSLDISYTKKLLTESNKAYNTEISDLLLAALSLSFESTFNMEKVLISIEGHGRQQLSETININRTIGWFTIHYPVVISNAHEEELGQHLIEVKETLRKIPHKGIGYGINKFLSGNDAISKLSTALSPQIAFNYLGQFDSDVEDLFFSVSSNNKGENVSPESDRLHDLAFNGLISDGQLSVSLEYNKYQFEYKEMQDLINSLKKSLIEIIDHCSGIDNELTPSDITQEDLSMDDLDEIAKLLN